MRVHSPFYLNFRLERERVKKIKHLTCHVTDPGSILSTTCGLPNLARCHSETMKNVKVLPKTPPIQIHPNLKFSKGEKLNNLHFTK